MALQQIPEPSAAGLQPKYQKFTSSGTFTLPTGYGVSKPLLVQVQVIGGGGAGSPSLANVTTNSAPRTSFINYFGDNGGITFNNFPTAFGTKTIDITNNQNGRGGGSGGLAATQFYLTSNLTITVGAGGTKPGTSSLTVTIGGRNDMTNTNEAYNAPTNSVGTYTAGGTGGTSTAGAVSAIGGNPANSTGGRAYNFNFSTDGIISSRNTNYSGGTPTMSSEDVSNTTGNAGSAGQPAGSAGDAVPLLGTLAGGSGNTTPVYGSFGIGGKRGDVNTHSGVDGTGGGHGSVGSSGAVILTWWE